MTLPVPQEGASIYGPRARADYKIDSETGCWIWQKSIAATGYPSGRPYRRYYELAHGPIPAEHEVHHVCRNRACVNPAHLEARTFREHRAEHWFEKLGLTLADLREIRRRGAEGATIRGLAAEFGINYKTVNRILMGQRWTAELGEGPVRQHTHCLECGVELTGYRTRKWCSTACRQTTHNKRRRAPLREAA